MKFGQVYLKDRRNFVISLFNFRYLTHILHMKNVFIIIGKLTATTSNIVIKYNYPKKDLLFILVLLHFRNLH